MGFDARALTPLSVPRLTAAAAEARPFRRAAIVMQQVGGQGVSAKTIERVVHDVGRELAARRDADPKTDDALAPRPAGPPAPAVVECDGGRIRTRLPGHGPGVHRDGPGRREAKNACLIKGTHGVCAEGPRPEPPDCFSDPEHVAQIADTAAVSVATPPPAGTPEATGTDRADPAPPPRRDGRPQRLVRTILAGMATALEFGRQMAREAKRRRSFEAAAQAFPGDGLPWNRSIRKRHFGDFTPILAFIHVLSDLYLTAQAVWSEAADAWDRYLTRMRGCWRGEVDQVLEGLRQWPAKPGLPPEEAAETDPRRVVATTRGYLEHNRERMRYPGDRRGGLPVTTAWMESVVKGLNYRVKGTEMFWNDPEGAEAILQVRAAALSDDARLLRHLRSRPGCPFTRRPKARKLSTQRVYEKGAE